MSGGSGGGGPGNWRRMIESERLAPGQKFQFKAPQTAVMIKGQTRDFGYTIPASYQERIYRPEILGDKVQIDGQLVVIESRQTFHGWIVKAKTD